MGNANSGESLEPAFEYDFRGRSVEAIASKIINTHKNDTEKQLNKLAVLVFKAASGSGKDRRMTIKVARLVKLLGGITVPRDDGQGFVTFNEVFKIIITIDLMEFANRDFSEYKTINTMFLAELFIIDEVYAARMLLWLDLLEGFPRSKRQLLELIRKKVEFEIKKPSHSQDVDALYNMLNRPDVARTSTLERAARSNGASTSVRSSGRSTPEPTMRNSGASTPEPTMRASTSTLPPPQPFTASTSSLQPQPGPSTPFPQPWQSVPSVSVQPYINATAPEYDSPPPYAMYAPSFNYPPESTQNSSFDLNYGWALPSRANSISSFESLPDQFDRFLTELKQNPSQTFDLEKFEACSDDDRKKCAKMVLDAVLEDAKVIEPLAIILQTIQCTYPPENVDHMAFSDHLSILIEPKIDDLVKQTSKWVALEKIGSFLAHLYNFECITNVTLRKWFDALQPSVTANSVKGTKVYVSVLKLSLEQMQVKNPPKFKFHVLQLQNLAPTVWLAPELQEWRRDFLSYHLEDVLSVNANSQQVNGGKVRKISTYSRGFSTYFDENNPFVSLQMILHSLNTEDDLELALAEIVALEIEATARNLRRITNMMTAKVAGHPDVMELFVKALEALPEKAQPAFDKNEIKDPMKLSILDHLFSLQKDAKFPKQRFENLADFMKILEEKELIDSETVAEIIETLAVVARPEDKKTLIIVVAKLLDIFGASLIEKGVALKETEATLERHCNNKSFDTKKLAAKALQKLSQRNGENGLEDDALDCPSTKSFTSGRVENKERFFEFLLELPSKSFEDTRLMLSKVKNADHCEEFAAAFYEAAMKTEQFLLFARFAQIIEREFQSVGTATVFKKSLVEILFTPFSPMGQQQMKASKMIENRVKFIGELYKIRWVDINGLTTVFDMLSETEVLVQLFHALLNIVELTIAQNGDGEKLVKYRKLYVRRQDGYKDSTSDYLICLEVVEMLSEIATLCGKRFVFDADTVKTLIDDLNMNNIEEQAFKIETMSEGTKKEFELIVAAILNKLAESDDDQLMSSFSAKLLGVFKESKALLKEKFVDKCLKLLISKFMRGEVKSAFTTMEFFAKLYAMNVVSANFIALCCEILFDGSNENKIICLSILLTAVGAKFESEDPEAVTKVFEGFEDFLAEEAGESNAAANLRNLIEFRANGWKAAGTSQSPLQKSIVLLKNLNHSNISAESTCAEFVSLCENNPKELVVSFYFSVVQEPSKAELFADMCELIHKQAPEFTDHLNDYLQTAVKGLSSLQKHEYEEDTLHDLAAVINFIGELFALDLMDDDTFASLLKPAKHLRFDSINQLAVIVGDKVSMSENNQLKSLLMSLEDIAQSDSNRFWDDLKKDTEDRSFQ